MSEAAEAPKYEPPMYRLHHNTVIDGPRGQQLIRTENGPVDVTLAGHKPRNSWEPLNESARDAFRRRDKTEIEKMDARIAEVQAQIDEVKAIPGTGEAELAGFNEIMAKLRLERAQLPAALKKVPTFGGSNPTHSLNFAPGTIDKEAPAPERMESRLEKLVRLAINGGGSDADVAEIIAGFRAKAAAAPAEPVIEAKPVQPMSEQPKAAGKRHPRASDSQ